MSNEGHFRACVVRADESGELPVAVPEEIERALEPASLVS
jgi:hypothetical protein